MQEDLLFTVYPWRIASFHSEWDKDSIEWAGEMD